MAPEAKSRRAASALSVSVGERVTVGDSATEYVVLSVDPASGLLELLRLEAGKIERDVPEASVRKKGQAGTRVNSKG